AQACAVSRELGFDPTKVNPNGSGISLGHPIGATGALITVKALHELRRVQGRHALVTMCIGGGQGIAAIFERLSVARTRPARQPAWEADLPTLSEEDGIRYLHFNPEWIQGAMRIARPSELVLAYTQQMMAWLLFAPSGARDRIGILGLGAGSLLRFTLRHTRSRIETVERNPAVTAMCRAFFRLPGSARSVVDH